MMATNCLEYEITVNNVCSLYYSIHRARKRNRNAVHGEHGSASLLRGWSGGCAPSGAQPPGAKCRRLIFILKYCAHFFCVCSVLLLA